MNRLTSTIILLSLACGVDLQPVSPTSIVRCASDADCPDSDICAPAVEECFPRADTTPPQLTSASAPSGTEVLLVFNEPLRAHSVADVDLYSFAPELLVSRPQLSSDATSVLLSTEAQPPGRSYTAEVGEVTDLQGNFLDPAHAQASFTSFGDLPDPTPPEALVPPDGQTLRSLDVTLAWTGRLGALHYDVEVDDDPAFGSPLDLDPVLAPDNSVAVTLPDDGVYHWRVRADSTVGDPTPALFVALAGAIHVYCPVTESCDSLAGGQFGTANHPFQSMAWAMVQAKVLGADRVNMASRDGPTPYLGSLAIDAVAIDVFGGYDPTFSTRDPVAWPTVIESDGTTGSIVAVDAPVVFDGLTFRSTATGFNGTALAVLDSELVHLNDIVVEMVDETDVAWPLYLKNTDATVTGSRIEYGGARLVAAGIHVEGGSIAIERTVVVGGTTSVATVQQVSAVDVTMGADVLVDRSILYAEGTPLKASGISRFVLRNSLLVAAGMRSQVWGLLLSATPEVALINNTIVAMPNPLSPTEAVAVRPSGANPRVTNNLIVCPGSPATEIGYREAFGSLEDPSSFQNNAMVGCDTLYRDEDSGSDLSLAELNSLADPVEDAICEPIATCPTARFGDNLELALSMDQLFLDWDGPDDDLSTWEDNDLRLASNAATALLASGGKDPTATDCGAIEVPQACDGSLVDLDSAERTLPVTIGAFERE